MKKALVLFICMIMALSLIACSKDKDDSLPEGMTYTENGAVDFKLYYPEEWILDRNDGMVSVRVSDTDHSNVSVTAFTAPAEVQNVEEYLKEEYLGYVKENFPDLALLADNEKTTLGGVDARRNVFTATVAGESYKFMQIFTYRYGYIYIFTYTSTAEGFDAHLDEVNRIIKEFKFN